jgi:RNA polymerase sigma-70 factor (ECF subfamily)
MADEKAEFQAALQAVRNGSPDALWTFIEKYGPKIQRIARRQMDHQIQSKFDSVDFVQMVWASFFRDPQKMRSFHQPQDIFHYLIRMVRNKLCDEQRRNAAAKNDVSRERPLQASDQPVHRIALTPSHVAMAKEVWARMIEGETEKAQRIAEMRLGGATINEISEALQINEKTVRRTIARLLATYKRSDGSDL